MVKKSSCAKILPWHSNPQSNGVRPRRLPSYRTVAAVHSMQIRKRWKKNVSFKRQNTDILQGKLAANCRRDCAAARPDSANSERTAFSTKALSSEGGEDLNKPGRWEVPSRTAPRADADGLTVHLWRRFVFFSSPEAHKFSDLCPPSRNLLVQRTLLMMGNN